jgi:dTMP kinase
MPLIAVEGIDGTGKSTHTRMLAEWLISCGHDTVTSHEPTDGKWGRLLRKSAATGRLSPTEELEYFLCDRREHVENFILPALAAGKYVILDRYYFSTMAYQGLRGFDPIEIRILNEEFAPIPDRLIILDLEVDAALERINARGDTANEFEKYDTLVRCRETFLSLKDEPFVTLISTAATPDEVHAIVRDAITG